MMKIGLEKVRLMYARYERWLIPGALLFGFLLDVFTFGLINFNTAIMVLVGHLFITGLGIVIINLYEDGVIRGRGWGYVRVLAPVAIQLSFGAMFSAFIIFYTASSSLNASYPFIAVLIFLAIANEIFRKYNTRPDIQIGTFFFALFSFINLAVPYLLRKLGPMVFILSGILSLVIIYIFSVYLIRLSRRVAREKKRLMKVVLAVLVSMNVLYFSNIIPPIPLAMRDVGVYYYVHRNTDGTYSAVDRERSSMEKLLLRNNFIVVDEYTSAYALTSVFAPAGLDIDIIHEWQYLDPNRNRWVTTSSTRLPISGGRSEGYRVFSTKSNLQEGTWRLNVRTPNGQIVGRHRFHVVYSSHPVELRNVIK